jgi:hypothetical protein
MSPTIQELKKYLKDKGKLNMDYIIYCVMKAKCLLLQPRKSATRYPIKVAGMSSLS